MGVFEEVLYSLKPYRCALLKGAKKGTGGEEFVVISAGHFCVEVRGITGEGNVLVEVTVNGTDWHTCCVIKADGIHNLNKLNTIVGLATADGGLVLYKVRARNDGEGEVNMTLVARR